MKCSSVTDDASDEFVLGPDFHRGHAAGRIYRPLGNLVGLGQGRDTSMHVLTCGVVIQLLLHQSASMKESALEVEAEFSI